MSVSFGEGNNYNYYNNQVKVPFKPQEEQPREEVVIPFREGEAPESPEDNGDSFVTLGHGGDGSLSYDVATGPSVSIVPYRFDATVVNDNKTVKFSAGPEFKVSSMGTKPISPLNLFSPNGAVALSAGGAVSTAATVSFPGSNTALYAAGNASLGYQFIRPTSEAKQSSDYDISQENPSGHTFAYDLDGRLGTEIAINDKNSVRAFVYGRAQGYSGEMTRKWADPEDCTYVEGSSELTTKESSYVVSTGLGSEYVRKLDKGEISVSAQAGYGGKGTHIYNATAPEGQHITSTGAKAPFGSVTVSFRF